ncbi:hypothetical protein BpHYR1_027325 [Brachionus plicatilis]|uniref:Uncharacterized protein n=1 Tax=Brachionus plicatilis TaxID=10195 RepID=A0A3M7P5M2_BRAPC|nr:hypothetical protein BpHYR1_027325 [Brachionus plicatilis]
MLSKSNPQFAMTEFCEESSLNSNNEISATNLCSKIVSNYFNKEDCSYIMFSDSCLSFQLAEPHKIGIFIFPEISSLFQKQQQSKIALMKKIMAPYLEINLSEDLLNKIVFGNMKVLYLKGKINSLSAKDLSRRRNISLYVFWSPESCNCSNIWFYQNSTIKSSYLNSFLLENEIDFLLNSCLFECIESKENLEKSNDQFNNCETFSRKPTFSVSDLFCILKKNPFARNYLENTICLISVDKLFSSKVNFNYLTLDDGEYNEFPIKNSFQLFVLRERLISYFGKKSVLFYRKIEGIEKYGNKYINKIGRKPN